MLNLCKQLERLVVFASAFLVLATGCLAQTQRSLSVSVVTKRGHPVWGVALILAAEDRVRSGMTGANGKFEFTDLPELKFALDASYLGVSIAAMQDIDVPSHGPKNLSIILDPPGGYFLTGLGSSEECMLVHVESVPDGPGPISYEERQGKVSVTATILLARGVKEEIGRAVKIAALRAESLQAPVSEVESNENGEFHFDDLEPGKYRLRVSHEGSYTGMTVPFWVARGNTTRLGPIIMFPNHATDICGTGTGIIMFEDPGPELELVDPTRKP